MPDLTLASLAERLEALADSLDGDQWNHPLTAQADCRAAAACLRTMATRLEQIQQERLKQAVALNQIHETCGRAIANLRRAFRMEDRA